jgi:hypothetical protein
MTKRKSEDVMSYAACDNEDCDMYCEDVEIHGRFNADGKFEEFESEDMTCNSCGSRLVGENED